MAYVTTRVCACVLDSITILASLDRPGHVLRNVMAILCRSRTHQGDSHRKSLSEPVNRERNRTAAAKCRAKSKVAEEDLKETQRIERERNRQLRATVEELSNESLMLRHELLCHSDCDHPIINNYLSRTADQISRGCSGSSRTR
ncbi:hypothetical protein KJ359_000738 [Pestalotiopsis sp. 9143b]|nr:hypothetical protein KJ359_000738 [Pestalotiopsis sp. 9143b]